MAEVIEAKRKYIKSKVVTKQMIKPVGDSDTAERLKKQNEKQIKEQEKVINDMSNDDVKKTYDQMVKPLIDSLKKKLKALEI